VRDRGIVRPDCGRPPNAVLAEREKVAERECGSQQGSHWKERQAFRSEKGLGAAPSRRWPDTRRTGNAF